MAMPPASQQSKPVYYAGEGFDDQAPRRRGALFVLALLLPSLAVLTGLLFWYLQLEDETWTIRVDSQPPGAVVLLDTKATDFLTPAEIPLTGRDPVLVQVRAPGMSSDPLVYQLNAGRDTSLLFKLQEIQRPAAIEPIDTPVVEDQEAPELQEALLAARLGEDLEGTGAAAGRQPIAAESSRSNASVTDSGQPAATPRFNMPSISAESPAAVTQSVPPRRQAELLFGNWRDTFRLRIDEREISYENAVTLTPGPPSYHGGPEPQVDARYPAHTRSWGATATATARCGSLCRAAYSGCQGRNRQRRRGPGARECLAAAQQIAA